MNIGTSPVPEAVEAVRRGRMVVAVDDSDRHDEDDVVMATERAAVTRQTLTAVCRRRRGLRRAPMHDAYPGLIAAIGENRVRKWWSSETFVSADEVASRTWVWGTWRAA
jgi:hypothetical protein